MYSRIISAGIICLFLAACNGQEQPEVINKTIEIKEAPKVDTEKSTQQKIRPALNLSVDNVSIDHQNNNDDIFNANKEPAETQNKLFEILNRDRTDPDISVSGKFFTDEEKVDNKEYLNSINGAQINIEGNFE